MLSKDPGSLGYGLYSFEKDAYLAKLFASKFTSHPAVITFNIDCPDNTILKLFPGTKDTKIFEIWLSNVIETPAIRSILTHYTNSSYQKSLDGALIEAFITDMAPKMTNSINCITSATHTYIGKLSKIPMSFPNSIEYCIRSTRIIQNSTITKIEGSDFL